jgi:AcrR family transcriptional regulator
MDRSGDRLRLGGTIRRQSPFSKIPSEMTPTGNLSQSPTATRPRRADAQRNVDRLISAARDAFATHGFNAPLDDIARAAGVGAGTLYRHFPTRLALFEAVYRDNVERLCADGKRLAATEPPAQALVDWLKGFVTVVSQKRGLAAALTEEGRTSEVFGQCHTMINDTGGELLARAKSAGAVRDDVDLGDLLKMAKAFAQAAETSPEGPALAERLLDLSLDGLRPRAEGSPARG